MKWKEKKKYNPTYLIWLAINTGSRSQRTSFKSGDHLAVKIPVTMTSSVKIRNQIIKHKRWTNLVPQKTRYKYANKLILVTTKINTLFYKTIEVIFCYFQTSSSFLLLFQKKWFSFDKMESKSFQLVARFSYYNKAKEITKKITRVIF